MAKKYDAITLPVDTPYLRIIPEIVEGDALHGELVVALKSIEERYKGLMPDRFLSGELHLLSGLQYLASVPYFQGKKLEGLCIPNDDLFDMFRKVQNDLLRRPGEVKLSYCVVHELIRVAMKGGRSIKICRIK